jgi:hypothetical protein
MQMAHKRFCHDCLRFRYEHNVSVVGNFRNRVPFVSEIFISFLVAVIVKWA